MMEEEFYGTIKLISGEEIFAEILPVKEEGRTLLLLSDPVEVQTVPIGSNGVEGVKIDPWIKSQSDSVIVIDMDKVITILEADQDSDMIRAYKKFLRTRAQRTNKSRLSKKMGYLDTVANARVTLEKIYNMKATNTDSEL